ncbi:class I SAM-dependent rRNA methyltransferase [Streptococcus halichoeri]|uniref:class I SAM-dependent rRNA methyltransferase n=1 Tax=Streptococcus halichoeri TaxID=254785 RepID=UPI00135B54C6|nr:class I SAM-dependent rRNA methyltransferase [Streptococcus halichoeri]
MSKLYINSFLEKKLMSGVQLLDGEALDHQMKTDQIVYLYAKSSQRLIGTAYLSRQNKGSGWFLGQGKISLTKAYFVQLFQAAKAKRKAFETSKDTTAYRLFNQEGDDFGGLTIDRYDDFAVFSWYNHFVYQQLPIIMEAFQAVFPDIKGAYSKIRYQTQQALPESSHLYGEHCPKDYVITENGVRYHVFLNNGLMTGIFLDQHDVRLKLVQGLARGASVLNLFSYTAAFSVAAAIGGASSTTSVDLAKRSKELSLAHFRENGLDPKAHRFYVMDVFEYYKYAKRKGLKYDVIVIDPPSFARNKKQTFSVTKDYHRLIAQALDLLQPGGYLIASTNAANMSKQQFKQQLQKGFGGHSVQVVDFQQLPDDFTINSADERSNYLKVFTMKVQK